MIELILLPSIIVFIGSTFASVYLTVLLFSNWKGVWWDIGYAFTLNTDKNVVEALAAKHFKIGIRLLSFRRLMLRILFRLFPISLLLIFFLQMFGMVET
ncbi:hypothetical protein EOL70_00110 [Leucothrix sargassi]|nr:hypothetical protein EOL70_00110 [Leucothrix sargassi]